jgi:cytochrome b subunit of formate dehydrogenase
LLVNGVLNVLQGIAAIAQDEVYARVDNYIYRINLTGWGWILVVLGVVLAVTGAGILKGAEWARLTGIVLASLSIIAQFMFLPYAPLWGLIMIVLDFFVIWALAVYRPDAARA